MVYFSKEELFISLSRSQVGAAITYEFVLPRQPPTGAQVDDMTSVNHTTPATGAQVE